MTLVLSVKKDAKLSELPDVCQYETRYTAGWLVHLRLPGGGGIIHFSVHS